MKCLGQLPPPVALWWGLTMSWPITEPSVRCYEDIKRVAMQRYVRYSCSKFGGQLNSRELILSLKICLLFIVKLYCKT